MHNLLFVAGGYVHTPDADPFEEYKDNDIIYMYCPQSQRWTQCGNVNDFEVARGQVDIV